MTMVVERDLRVESRPQNDHQDSRISRRRRQIILRLGSAYQPS